MLKSTLALALSIGLAIPAQAAMQLAPVEKSVSPVILVYGGCGPYGHRGPYGGCRAGGPIGRLLGLASVPSGLSPWTLRPTLLA